MLERLIGRPFGREALEALEPGWRNDAFPGRLRVLLDAVDASHGRGANELLHRNLSDSLRSYWWPARLALRGELLYLKSFPLLEARMLAEGDEVELPEAEGERLVEAGVLEASRRRSKK